MKQKLPASTVAALLGKIAALDDRKVTPEKAIEFAAALDPMTLEDAKAAVVEHRNQSAEWLMPSHLNVIVRTMRRHRLQSAPTAQPPHELDGDPGKEMLWIKTRNEGIGNGLEVTVAETLASHELGVIPSQLPKVADRFLPHLKGIPE